MYRGEGSRNASTGSWDLFHVSRSTHATLAGIYSVRLGRRRRVLYEIDDAKHVVIVLDVRRRSAAYRHR